MRLINFCLIIIGKNSRNFAASFLYSIHFNLLIFDQFKLRNLLKAEKIISAMSKTKTVTENGL